MNHASAGTELLFIFFGVGLCGLMLLVLGLFLASKRIFRPAPKPTQWKKEWNQIEDNLSK